MYVYTGERFYEIEIQNIKVRAYFNDASALHEYTKILEQIDVTSDILESCQLVKNAICVITYNPDAASKIFEGFENDIKMHAGVLKYINDEYIRLQSEIVRAAKEIEPATINEQTSETK